MCVTNLTCSVAVELRALMPTVKRDCGNNAYAYAYSPFASRSECRLHRLTSVEVGICCHPQGRWQATMLGQRESSDKIYEQDCKFSINGSGRLCTS